MGKIVPHSQQRVWGLVIQGPMTSYGRAGRSAHISESIVKEHDLERVDCRPLIERTIDDYRNLFKQIVVATWKGEADDTEGWEGVTVLAIDDPGGYALLDTSYKTDNRHRQCLGALRGLEELDTSITHAVRVRTDQYVDLAALLRSYESVPLLGDRTIGVPYVHPRDFLVSDFYLAGQKEHLRDLFAAALAYGGFEFSPNIHRDLVLKYAYKNHRGRIGAPEWAYFPRALTSHHAHPETAVIFNAMFSEVFVSLDKKILASATWRGSSFSREYVERSFDAANTESLASSGWVPALISIDWKRYYAFRRITGRQLNGVLTATHVWLGELSRKALHGVWIFVRISTDLARRITQ